VGATVLYCAVLYCTVLYYCSCWGVSPTKIVAVKKKRHASALPMDRVGGPKKKSRNNDNLSSASMLWICTKPDMVSHGCRSSVGDDREAARVGKVLCRPPDDAQPGGGAVTVRSHVSPLQWAGVPKPVCGCVEQNCTHTDQIESKQRFSATC